uniref:Uncharacterized protein n=1 Tax=Alexandrium catenella TaxID=2925 RepID=A0A7S1WHU2_ALECA
MYLAAKVTSGYCQDLDFETWNTEECFTGAALFHSDLPGSRELLLAGEAAEARRFAERQGMKYEEVVGQLKEMCQSPTAGLYSAPLTEISAKQDGPLAPKQAAYHILPGNGMACVEGTPFYLSMALGRLQSHPILASSFANSTVEEGTCMRHLYRRGPFPNSCFPGATVHLGEGERQWWDLLTSHRQLARRVSESDGITFDAALARMAEPCDNGDGSLSEGLYRELRGMPPALVDPRPRPGVAHIIPDNGMACLQGEPKYLALALSKMKSSAYGALYTKTSAPTDGFCSSAGYTIGSGAGVTAGVGFAHNRCFPEAHTFWDNDVVHHHMAGKVEWGIIGEEYAPAYKENVIQASLVCAARRETVFDAPPKALFEF